VTSCEKPSVEEKTGRDTGASVLIYICSGNFRKGQEGRVENGIRE